MRQFSLFILLTILLANFALAQEDKYTPQLKNLYEEKAYLSIINFKKKKERKMSAKSLYYKGMAYYMTDEDQTASEYLSKAIKKGTVLRSKEKDKKVF